MKKTIQYLLVLGIIFVILFKFSFYKKDEKKYNLTSTYPVIEYEYLPASNIYVSHMIPACEEWRISFNNLDSVIKKYSNLNDLFEQWDFDSKNISLYVSNSTQDIYRNIEILKKFLEHGFTVNFYIITRDFLSPFPYHSPLKKYPNGYADFLPFLLKNIDSVKNKE